MFRDAKKLPNYCPIIKETCVGANCQFSKTIEGTHPQTGERLNAVDCAINFAPELAMEGNALQHGANAVSESTRNESVRQNDQIIQLLSTLIHTVATAQPTVIVKENSEKLIASQS